ncbi:DUF268 domain-containing protein [Candidatus Parcubacteria bacterium]|nr:DUF268 domain-containing protein [Candidatus Parcubacteria bacterium]
MKESLREKLKRITPLKLIIVIGKSLRDKHGLLSKIKKLSAFFKDYLNYRVLAKNKKFSLEIANLYPRLFDKTSVTAIDPVYFYQNAWCAKKIFENKPEKHFDIGSDAKFVGLISQFTPTTMIDIRPIPVLLENLSFIKGDILNLPFKDGEIASLSSICVLEHIGLGRYGDELDQFGSEKAFKELIRVLSPGGSLYISVPVDKKNKIYFNAHRAFTRNYIIELSDGLKLEEEKYIYGNTLYDAYDPQNGFGTGLYHFKKII